MKKVFLVLAVVLAVAGWAQADQAVNSVPARALQVSGTVTEPVVAITSGAVYTSAFANQQLGVERIYQNTGAGNIEWWEVASSSKNVTGNKYLVPGQYLVADTYNGPIYFRGQAAAVASKLAVTVHQNQNISW